MPLSAPSPKPPVLPRGMIFPFLLLASCFLWWGMANNLTDPLVRVFRDIFGMSTFAASFIQFAFYGGYFLMALPGAMIARKYTYKTGVLLGLGIYATGCLLLYPAAQAQMFGLFLFAFGVLACGLGVLETNANPYVFALGPEETATRRLNFAQSFNPVGSVIGVLLAQVLIFANLPQDEAGNVAIPPEETTAALDIVVFPYLAIAAILVLVWILIAVTKMPRAREEDNHVHLGATVARLLKNRNYVFAVVAQFFNIGAQITVWTYTNFYIPEAIGVSQEVALRYHTGALVLFGASRWLFTGLMSRFRASTLLVASAVLAVVACVCVIVIGGMVGVIALISVSGFMSLMFPTLFGLGCTGLGEDTKIGASGMIMAIVGGAIITPAQGALLDAAGVSVSYVVPLVCFAVIAAYALRARTRGVDVAG